MGEIQHEVVGVGNLKSLDFFRLMTNLTDSGFNVVLSLHECLILGLDLANDTSGVNVGFPFLPVDGGELALIGGRLIEEVENGLDLAELVSAFHGS